MTVTRAEIGRAIEGLGLSRKPLCVHSSLRSFGWVEGGAEAVIDGILGEGCTLLVPTHFYEGEIRPPADLRPERNGIDYEAWDEQYAGRELPGETFVFTPQSNEISSQYMGVIPTTVLQRPDRDRGNHPGGSFTALGPLARLLIEDQSPVDIFAPFRALAALGGFVILMGVGLDRLTLLHYAEVKAGRNLFMRWANGPDGQPIPMFGGGCSHGFPKLEPFLASVIGRARVGDSSWMILPVTETVEAAAAAIRQQPDITHCGRSHCLECRDAVLGGPILDLFWTNTMAR